MLSLRVLESQKRVLSLPTVPWSNRRLKFRVQLAREGRSVSTADLRFPYPFSPPFSLPFSLILPSVFLSWEQQFRIAALQAAPKIHIHASHPSPLIYSELFIVERTYVVRQVESDSKCTCLYKYTICLQPVARDEFITEER